MKHTSLLCPYVENCVLDSAPRILKSTLILFPADLHREWSLNYIKKSNPGSSAVEISTPVKIL